MHRKKAFLFELRKNRTLFIMVAPMIIYFLIFSYVPMAGIILAFKSFQYDKGILFSPWVGFENFKFFFLSGKAWILTRNTVFYNLSFIVTGIVLQVFVALIISELNNKYIKKISHSIMFLPYFISWVVVSAFIYNIFNFEFGSLNSLLKFLHIEPVDVYGTTEVWKYILVGSNLWKYTGYGSIIYLAAIMSINTELYESAELDGASIFQRIRFITLPMITSTIIIMVLLNLGSILRGNFDLFFQIIGYNGLLYNSTDVIDTFVFRALKDAKELGMPAAIGLYQQFFGFIFVISANYVVRRINKENAIF